VGRIVRKSPEYVRSGVTDCYRLYPGAELDSPKIAVAIDHTPYDLHMKGRAVRAGCVAAVLTVLAVHAGAAVAFGPPGEAGQRMRLTPEQRQQMWQQMTPEQREAFRGARTPDERQRAWQELSPDQRRGMWQQLSPEQRELMMRRVTPEERRQMWEKMSPGEREAMRQRFLQRPPADPGPEGHRRLTPEERQRLRDQIREQGGWKGSQKKGGSR
jgi:predicted Fe-S protein YdhL (DUF1289 family)